MGSTDQSVAAAFEEIEQLMRSGELLDRMVAAESRRKVPQDELSERLEHARRRLAHYERTGDEFFAAVEREGIAWLEARQ